jgi:hypothetical protein
MYEPLRRQNIPNMKITSVTHSCNRGDLIEKSSSYICINNTNIMIEIISVYLKSGIVMNRL